VAKDDQGINEAPFKQIVYPAATSTIIPYSNNRLPKG
jgi:hypothetical protein